MNNHIGQQAELAINITRIVDKAFPIWVEVEVLDIDGQYWRFTDKWSIFSSDTLDQLPAEGWLRCTIEEQAVHEQIGLIFKVNTECPDHVHADSGQPAMFWVRAEQIRFGEAR